ncbi:WD40 repeat domain-containing protein [Nostoc sphaeroides]|uniref:Effector-associated domain-containing protein n=1 Tax=Nostoc sphaeroides CCNUC1 TaxID=2653204 RepID=A0A5P8WAD3_9NOSO|nr:WD40 repeat domain-containing protein [Nostoc sphaeroides]QFS49753.1 hypothetical protein GXM_07247 [Nostoc sphaeroides CCNUC1]
MAHIDQLKQILHRVEKGQQTDEDITFLRQLLSAGDRQIVSQLGKYNINIGEGRDIHIGDRIYQQWDEQAIQALVKAIQKVNWRCVSNLTENDYTQSTGVSIIDKLAKTFTDFSQKNVMRYGLKLAFSPNHNQEYFVSAVYQVIKHWKINTWEILQEIPIPNHLDMFTSITISPNAQLIAACTQYQIQIWRLGEKTALHTLSKTIFSNFFDFFGFDSITFSPDGKILAANDNRDIKLWDVESGKEIAKLSGHCDKVTCVAFNPTNGRILASCSYDKTIKLWDIDSKRCLGTLSAHRDAVYTLAFSPDGEILASGSNDNTIKLWHLNTGEIPQTRRHHSDAVTCLVFSPDGKTLVSGSNDETIVEWKITENELQVFPERHRRGITSIAFSPDGETLISGGRDQTIKVWRR